MIQSYRQLMATTRAVLRNAATMIRRVGQRVRTASPQVQPTLLRAQTQLQQMRPLVQQVIAQTRARLLGGDTHVANKVLSIFEPHTETIRKGKIATPNELGSWSLSRKRSIRSLRAMRCMPRGRQIAPCGRLRSIGIARSRSSAGSGRRRSRIQFGCQ